MAFPTTPVLESGGADEDPIATNWSGPIFTTGAGGQIRRTSNKLARQAASAGNSYWDIQQFGPDIEVYATVDTLTAGTNVDEGILYARLQSVGGATASDYVCYVSARATASTDRMRISRNDAGITTVLGTYVIGTIAAGDKYGMACIGSTIQGWYCPVSTGIWTKQLEVTDATYSGASYIGIHMARTDSRITNFGGGTVGQVALPDADTATGGWTTAPLFSKVNDFSDATVITATAA